MKERIDLEHLLSWCRNDRSRYQAYLMKFNELILERKTLLEAANRKKDRDALKQIVHLMRPQLQFFGLKDMSKSLMHIESNIHEIPYFSLDIKVRQILQSLNENLDLVNARLTQLQQDYE